MKKNLKINQWLVFILCLVFMATGYAGDMAKKGSCQCHMMKQKGVELEGKLFNKLHRIIMDKEDLKISDEQFTKIKDLKHNIKKELIRKQAEIDILAIDIKSKLWEDKIDKEGLDKLIDEKYEVKKAKTKALINAYVELQSLLTDDQKKKLKVPKHHEGKHK
ncbi:MAG: hypothetical protein JW774_07340 [Candidatus Aureabacteria bacterium]|nr:hypothetical protein [Candidatus Auribacterota bacterium]